METVTSIRKTVRLRSLRDITVVLIINVGSKFVGFVREVYISSLFGISMITDVFFAVQQVPLFISNYMFGAFNLAFIPQYAFSKKNGSLSKLIYIILKFLIIATSILTTVMIAGSNNVIPIITGIDKIHGSLVSEYSLIMSLSIIPMVLLGLGYGILHAERQHTKGMLFAAIPPVGMLLSLVIFSTLPFMDIQYTLPWSFVTGIIVGSIWGLFLIWKAIKESLRAQRSDGEGLTGVGFFKQLSAASIENVGFNVNQLLNVFFAGTTGYGSVAINTYAMRISMLALSGVVTPLNQVIQSWLSKKEDNTKIKNFGPILFGMSFIVILIAIILIFYRETMVRIIYQRGAFSPSDTVAVAQMLIPCSGYFVVMSLNQLFARYYYVLCQGGLYTMTLLGGYFISNILKVLLTETWGLPGVIWSCVIGEGMSLFFLIVRFLYKEVNKL